MKTKLLAAVCLGVSLLVLPAVDAAASDSPLQVTSFHAKAKVTVQPSGDQSPLTYQADYWVQKDLLKTEMVDPTSEQRVSTIMRGKLIYYWVHGSPTGTKVPADSQEGSGSSNFLDIARCLETGKNHGSETIDGVATTKYSYTDCGGSTGMSYVWIANDGGWAKQMKHEKGEASMTVTFLDVEAGRQVEETFFPPARIPFIAPPSLMPKPEGQ